VFEIERAVCAGVAAESDCLRSSECVCVCVEKRVCLRECVFVCLRESLFERVCVKECVWRVQGQQQRMIVFERVKDREGVFNRVCV